MGCTNSTLCPSPPLKPKQKLSLLSFVLQVASRRDGTLNRRLLWFAEFNARPNPNPVRGVRTTDFTVDPDRRLWCRLFLPAATAAGPLPVVIFFHGGGFSTFSAATREMDAFCRRLCRKIGVAVVSVNYRLSPEHRCPAQYDDGVDVLLFLESAKVDGLAGKDQLLREFFQAGDLSTCFLVGESAGANIAHNVARRWIANEHHIHLAGLVAIQPFFGGESRVGSEMRRQRGSIVSTKRTDWMWKAFLPHGATRDHLAASPAAAAENLGDGFPPVMVMVGELDPLLDWQWIYFQSLCKNGKEAEIIEYPGAIHASYLFPEFKGSPELIEDIRGFILRHSGRERRAGPTG